MIGVVTFRSVLQIVVRSIVQEITSFVTKEACIAVKRNIRDKVDGSKEITVAEVEVNVDVRGEELISI